ncbi:glycoside hydrolase family 26 protein [Flavihumibacter petaseus]|uniref:Mannan endo-1,4-beta-mannosidase n=1 Tax=Flavihumibacter petaseus NBRC 106054 TaxID=1220578 RepID=A0A0E9N6T0_9BACT|nr:glycosyl hydrolase [Flavihumibacter petaseus]GAO45534.1 putative beta-mannosidase [Flavihumibacter petaseus NBRC 106054]
MKNSVIILVLWLISPGLLTAQAGFQLIDKKATPETRMAATRLKQLSNGHILFGHQHATEYGHGWSGDAGRSDVKSVTGSHPAVIGMDLMGLSGLPDVQVQKNFDGLVTHITDTYNRGGITTLSWHFSNPASAGGFYWKDSVSAASVKLIIPGGSHHDQYKEILQRIGRLAHAVKGKDGSLAPLIFRPYHEFDGDWFWWGRSHCTTEDFKALWKFTVGYLRDSLQVHNFIYAFSPDNIFLSEAVYLERYPGDEWVDMVGTDNYGDFGRDGKYNLADGLKKLRIVSDYARKHNKLAAFTETGLESIPNTTWWTDILLKTLKSQGLELSYVLVWRNDENSPTHYYAPFPGQVSAPDFIRFYNDPFTLFEEDLRRSMQLYKAR